MAYRLSFEKVEEKEKLVKVPAAGVSLEGSLGVPHGSTGIVLFAHGSGSSRFSPRNQFVAQVLRESGTATLLIDLLTEKEEEIDRYTAQLRFDIDMLAKRLTGITDWLTNSERTHELSIGYFGASTGTAAALIAASERPNVVDAIVSRGGRPDLAKPVLSRISAPTLLIVGRDDKGVIEMNREALAMLKCEKKMKIVPGATHLFEEPGALERVAEMATEWFSRYLSQ